MPNHAKTRCTSPAVIAAVRKRQGKLYLAAADLGVTVQTLRNYAARWPEVQSAIREAKGRMLDTAEGKLFKAIDRGEPWAICFYLKCQGKKRGYVERSDRRGAGLKANPNSEFSVDLAELNLPVDVLRMIFAAIRHRNEQAATVPSTSRALPQGAGVGAALG